MILRQFCLIILSMILAINTSQSITDASKKKKSLEEEKARTESMISDLNQLKSDVNTYVQQLDEDIKVITAEIDGLNKEIAGKEAEIKAREKEITDLEAVSAEQYADMKLRIRYMYEQSDASVLDMLLGSDSLQEMLNRAEYVRKISVYDRKKMDEYEATRTELDGKRKELETERQELVESLNAAQNKKKDIETLQSEKRTEIEKYENQIGLAEVQLEEYQKEIRKQEETIKAIEAEIKRREEEARKAAEAAGKAYKTVDLGDLDFAWPCPGSSRITSYFGDREAPVEGASTSHKGIDIGASAGTAIVAAEDGEVIISAYSPSAGNYVMISHGGSVSTVYMHCSEVYVSVGEKVSRGQTIAAVGSTGYSTGPHLHFGIRAEGSYLNPLAYVSP